MIVRETEHGPRCTCVGQGRCKAFIPRAHSSVVSPLLDALSVYSQGHGRENEDDDIQRRARLFLPAATFASSVVDGDPGTIARIRSRRVPLFDTPPCMYISEVHDEVHSPSERTRLPY
jgi:hypothetical protein